MKFVKVSRVLAFVSVFAFGLLPFAFASLRALCLCLCVLTCFSSKTCPWVEKRENEGSVRAVRFSVFCGPRKKRIPGHYYKTLWCLDGDSSNLFKLVTLTQTDRVGWGQGNHQEVSSALSVQTLTEPSSLPPPPRFLIRLPFLITTA